MPQVEHAHLVAFAKKKVNLQQEEVDDQRRQVNNLRDRIEKKIKETAGYGLVKCLHAGSVAKGTALRNVNDRDLAVYVKAEVAPADTPSLVEWLRARVREAYPTLTDDQIVAGRNCVTVTFAGSGLSVDVVPVLYEGEPNDVGYLVEKSSGDRLKTSIRQHLDFIRSRKKVHSTDLAQLIRFTKWWARQQKRQDADFKCKSFMLELIWCHLADTGTDLSDYPVALEAFYSYVVKTGLSELVYFTDFDSTKPTRGSDPIEILDPVNLDNNVAGHYTDSDRRKLVAAAQDAYDAITTARFSTTKGEAVECWQDVLGQAFKGDL